MRKIDDIATGTRAAKRDMESVIDPAGMFDGAFEVEITDWDPAFPTANSCRTGLRVFAAKHNATCRTVIVNDTTLQVKFAPIVTPPAPAPRRRARA